ncbi:unknown protein [Oryza sativa Japonica Group]|uniref:Os01g0763800 protein n=2 Tax=Oryza sativa subsp. japonica TaxID=39947 RepID=C7IWN7_ORYSJ|nr:unknown protein [Oryza sativa Japonica Group]BAH91308.1 Os01g0763800 [Oryza sativa Japonica Group]BAS74479.1 Os01g0763800 [Oryza sativa Japonica Group]|eukprot:NP_001172578.1 Os01g0763800 [Oryza sativa Japonica Group]
MRKLCPNLDRNVVGSPLIPCPVPHDRAFSRSIRDSSIVSHRSPARVARARVHACSAAGWFLTRSSPSSCVCARVWSASVDGQVHHAAVHRGDGRAGGVAGAAEHVRRGKGADVRVGVPPRRPERDRRAGPRRGRRVRALAEVPRGLVLRAHHGRPQDERRQRRQGRLAPVRRRELPRLPRPSPPPPPLPPGAGPEVDREPVLRRGVHRREDHHRGGVLHPEAGGERGDAARPERGGVRHHPPHGVGLLQPAHGPAHPVGGLAPPPHEVRQGRPPQREHLLGDHHGVHHLRLPPHRWHQHRPRRPHRRHALPLRRGLRQPQAEAGGDVDGGGGRLQPVRSHHRLLPAALRPQEGHRREARRLTRPARIRSHAGLNFGRGGHRCMGFVLDSLTFFFFFFSCLIAK